MSLALAQRGGLLRCRMMSGGSMIDSLRARAPTAFGPMSLAGAAVAPIIWRRMAMLRVALAPPLCGRPRRP
jgi:hypothetical protein